MVKIKNVILDLDNTLIYAEPVEDMNDEIEKKFKFFKHHDMDGYYVVFERPGVQEFLDYLFENYNVSVWTAATKNYALFVIKNVILTKPERHLDYIFFYYHCGVSRRVYKCDKKLNLLWDTFKLLNYNEDNTIIIDDNDDVISSNPKNSIQIEQFDVKNKNSQKDKELEKIREKLEKLKD